MLCLNHNRHTARLQFRFDHVGDNLRHPLLHLWTSRYVIHDTSQFT